MSADLSRVKLEKLMLVTSHNNEDNYSGKVSAEIEEYKQIPLVDRRWNVVLDAGERFTWVFSTVEPYNVGNLKAWGFS